VDPQIVKIDSLDNWDVRAGPGSTPDTKIGINICKYDPKGFPDCRFHPNPWPS
jgi:hypothetical protein